MEKFSLVQNKSAALFATIKIRISLLSVIGALFLLLSLLFSGCRSSGDAGPSTPAPTADAVVEGVAPSTPTVDPRDPPAETRQLVVWTPEFMPIAQEDNAAQVLAAAVTQFEQKYPGVSVEFQIKAETGEASAFNYLRSAQKTAPGILPDVVVLPSGELWQAAELGLIQPLSAADLNEMGAFYTFAEQSVTLDSQILGIPYAADALHLVYRGEKLATSPRTWEELFDIDESYIFPTASRDGYSNDSLLLQYVGAGGELLESGEVSNPAALEAVFEFYVDGLTQGVIPKAVEGYASLVSVWDAFVTDEYGMADTSAHLILDQRDPLGGSGYGFAPTLIGDPATIGRTWAFAILTDDPDQQALVMELMRALLDPSVHGAWSQFSMWMPTQPAAFDAWSSGNAYYDFLRNDLAPSAVGILNGRRFADFSIRLQEAQQSVLSGQSSPADAVLEVRAMP